MFQIADSIKKAGIAIGCALRNRRNAYIVIGAAVAVCVVLLVAAANNKEPVPAPSETIETPSLTPVPEPPISQPKTFTEELSELRKRIDGSTVTIPLTEALYDSLCDGDSGPKHNTTPPAYENLINGSSDLIFVTYPSGEEFAAAEEEGVELEIIPIVKDALVFLVNIENPVENISLQELRNIYEGQITSWNEVGGLAEDIAAYQRPTNSGSQTLMLKLLMEGSEPMDAPAEVVVEDMGGLVDIVSAYDNSRTALGYSMFYYVNNMYGNSRFKLLSIDGVKPTRESIITGEYPLHDGYYAVMRGDEPGDSTARKLVDWLLTDEGQTLAAGAGYIPLRFIENETSGDDIDPIYVGDYNNSSGTGGTIWKGYEASEELTQNGVKRPLSDLFYDGFNYIEYINDKLFIELQTYNYWLTGMSDDLYLKRSFPGIPNDYPHYDLPHWQEKLIIEFPEDNPYFHGSYEFYLSLYKDVSPYGRDLPGYSVTSKPDGQLIPGVDFYMPIVSVADSPIATKRINDTLQKWVDGFQNDAGAIQQIEWYAQEQKALYDERGYVHKYRFAPVIDDWDDYLSISYFLEIFGGGTPKYWTPLVFSICFDMKTGATVKLTDKLPENPDFSEAWRVMPASWMTPEGIKTYDRPDEGYLPAQGSVISNAVVADGIVFYVTEPNGRVLFYVFGYDVF